ncbi:peptidoglycan DD-metalloendopeptidase family protein [Sulfuriferula nivalis]|uniref:Membrane protein n=1 Tax=Sulfuriferula nivalis TaxID=2675298 RepID=A0A809RLK4_9PROT|nr:peptidoglycan DD-metalloendopeptidase family protein [Sulfuriferula nivalis]BBP01684.1 membrane protein [Sulfuriferula nivalis]
MKWWWIGVVLVLAGCSTTRVAPVYDGTNYKNSNAKRAAANAKVRDWRPATYTVAKGDTLYSIALEYGLDYRELSGWNKLTDVNRIYVGQTLRLTEPATTVVKEGPQTSAMSPAVVTTQALPESVNITQPLALKLPYSEQAVAQLNQPKSDSQPVVSNSPVLSSKPLPAPPPVVKDVVKDVAPKEADDTALDWMWPAQGKTIAEFSEAQSSKGIDIAGTAGQPIFAAAAGKVVYSGSGLRGYGKLVIIKHNAIYLSAYAHNQTVLVKEGQTVQRGQKVAEMGNTDADQVKLHFEIRQMGKPVDPMKYLPEAGK